MGSGTRRMPPPVPEKTSLKRPHVRCASQTRPTRIVKRRMAAGSTATTAPRKRSAQSDAALRHSNAARTAPRGPKAKRATKPTSGAVRRMSNAMARVSQRRRPLASTSSRNGSSGCDAKAKTKHAQRGYGHLADRTSVLAPFGAHAGVPPGTRLTMTDRAQHGHFMRQDRCEQHAGTAFDSTRSHRWGLRSDHFLCARS